MSQVTVAQAKQHLRLSSSAADAILQIYIDACEEWLAHALGVAFTSASKTERADGGKDILLLSRKPVTAITSITDKYDDSTIDADEYFISQRGAIRESDQTQRWEGGSDRYEVVYTGGYGGTVTGDPALPSGIKLIVLQLVARVYTTRDGRASEGSTSGASISWMNWLDQDALKLMRAYSLKEFA